MKALPPADILAGAPDLRCHRISRSSEIRLTLSFATSAVLSLLYVVLAVGWVAWLLLTAPDSHERRTRLTELAIAALAAGLVLAVVDPATLPVDWLTPVREGSTDGHIHIAHGERAGARLLYVPWLKPTYQSLPALVRVQLAFAAATVVGLVALGRRVVGVGAATAIAAGWALSMPVRTAVMGGGSAPEMWPWMLVGGTGLAGWWRGTGRLQRTGGLAIATLATIQLAAARGEAVAWLAGPVLVGIAQRAGLHRAVVAEWRANRAAWSVAGVAALLIGLWTWEPVMMAATKQGRLTWVVRVLHPLAPSPLFLVPILLSAWSVGLVVLALVGGLRSPTRNLGLGLTAFAFFRLYHAAGHGDFVAWTSHFAWPLEMVRYGAFMAPSLAALAWWGWERLEGRGLRAIAAVLLLVPGNGALFPPRVHGAWQAPLWGSTVAPLALDNQVEVRFLVSAARHHAGCGLVAPGEVRPDGTRAWYAWRAGPTASYAGRTLRTLPQGTLQAAVDALPGKPDCVLLFTGLACAEPGGSCDGATAGLEPVEQVTRAVVSHAQPLHGWDAGSEVTWSLWRVRGGASSAPPASPATAISSGSGRDHPAG